MSFPFIQALGVPSVAVQQVLPLTSRLSDPITHKLFPFTPTSLHVGSSSEQTSFTQISPAVESHVPVLSGWADVSGELQHVLPAARFDPAQTETSALEATGVQV